MLEYLFWVVYFPRVTAMLHEHETKTKKKASCTITFVCLFTKSHWGYLHIRVLHCHSGFLYKKTNNIISLFTSCQTLDSNGSSFKKIEMLRWDYILSALKTVHFIHAVVILLLLLVFYSFCLHHYRPSRMYTVYTCIQYLSLQSQVQSNFNWIFMPRMRKETRLCPERLFQFRLEHKAGTCLLKYFQTLQISRKI